MNFLAPGWITLAAAAALGVVAIHLIAWRLPRAVILPTARFVPDEPARQAARTIRPSDLALMALRAGIIMLAGLALARPTRAVAPGGTAAVVAIERTGDSASVREGVGDIPDANHVSWVVFDTSAQVLTDRASAFSTAGTATTIRPSLTVGLLTAIREARRLTRDYERVSIILASTFTRDAFDQATTPVRSTWNDSIRVVRLPLTSQIAMAAPRIEVVSTGDDPVAAGVRLAESHGMLRGVSRVIRTTATAGDSAFAFAGGALLIWTRLTAGDERVDGIHAGDATVIGHFLRTGFSDSGKVIARWIDGTPAAFESASGAGCVRRIGFDVPDLGDFVLTTSFQRLVAAFAAPCGDAVRSVIAPDSVVAAIAARPASRASIKTPDDTHAPNRIAAILMVVAVALAIVELAMRRGTRAKLAEQAA